MSGTFKRIRYRARLSSWVLFSAVASSGMALMQGAQAQTLEQGFVAPKVDKAHLDYGLKARQIAKDTWVIEGAVDDFTVDNGCNIINTGFIATRDGTVVINTGPSRLYGEQQRQLIEATIAKAGAAKVVRVFNLNLHPDYFFGNQAWKGVPIEALPGTIQGQQAEGGAYADNLYRMCGDWMQGTESTPASTPVAPTTAALGEHRLELLRLHGHTRDDLVLIDRSTGVMFAGGLVFADRVPTTPHADFKAWTESLDALQQQLGATAVRVVVPSHGPVHEGGKGIAQTKAWINWLTTTMRDAAASGFDLSELLYRRVPAQFASWAAQPAEMQRSMTQWYPQYERAALRPTNTQ